MLCTTIKKGTDCYFMTKKGCTFVDGKCHETVAQCEGCGHIIQLDGHKFCKAYPDPAAKWQFGPCNLATHVQRKFQTEMKKVNPLKASKKAAAGKA